MTYDKLSPQQQRVWDAAYGAAFAAVSSAPYGRSEMQLSYAARQIADRAANSIQPNETK